MFFTVTTVSFLYRMKPCQLYLACLFQQQLYFVCLERSSFSQALIKTEYFMVFYSPAIPLLPYALFFSDVTIPPVRFLIISVVLLNLPLPVSCLKSLVEVECPNEIVKGARYFYSRMLEGIFVCVGDVVV